MLETKQDLITATREGKAPYFFDDETMKFWGSVLIEIYPVTNGCYFVTSEWNSPERTRKGYTVRFCDDEGSVNSISEFANLSQHKAKEYALQLQRDHRE